MNNEAIQKLKEFQIKNHLSGYNLQEPQVEQTDKVSESSVRKINYPEHIKPLKERIMSALANGCRTPESVANYCGTEDIKLINLQLCRWVSRGLIGRNTNLASGITRFYPHDIAKEKGFLTAPKPINRKKGKKAKAIENRSSSYQSPAPTTQLTQAEAFVVRNEATKSQLASKDYVAFLEKRIIEWQTECRRLASESKKYANQISNLEQEVIKAKTEPRNVTGEVAEVMEEVTKLRATVEYLESKLFGRK
jgi:hypothetical protein